MEKRKFEFVRLYCFQDDSEWIRRASVIGDSRKRVLTMATQPMFNITVRRRVWT